ncbi:MAG: S-layer homology domain-containing protein [Candidatus Margulisiibacteriota bacterium]
MKKLLLLTFLVLLALPVRAELAELGINPLQLEIGGRPCGMGGAFVGMLDDVNSIFYNPAGLAWAKGIEVSARDAENIAAIQAYPNGTGASLGLGILKQNVANIPVSGGMASSNNTVILLSYGTKLNFIPALYKNPLFQTIGVGLTLKGLVGETLHRPGQLDRSATGWDLDCGALWKVNDWCSVGASLLNFLPAKALGGGIIKWDLSGDEGIPAAAKLGTEVRVIGDVDSPVFMEGKELTFTGDINVSQSKGTLFRLGSEFGISRRYYLRAGLMQQYLVSGTTSNLNLGAGYRTNHWGVDFSTYHEPISDSNGFQFSVLYFPKDWIVVKKLEVEKPKIQLDQAIESISIGDNIVTYDDKIAVYGKVKAGVQVYVNGSLATTTDNTFKAIVPLKLQKNLIVVEARYEGEKKLWTYKVLRKAKVKVADVQKKEEVVELVTLGVIEITPESNFVMDAGVTRGELATWLVKATDAKLPEIKQDPFPDVPRTHPLAPYIKAAVDMGLLKPYADGTFRPSAVVSKAEGDAIFKKFSAKK